MRNYEQVLKILDSKEIVTSTEFKETVLDAQSDIKECVVESIDNAKDLIVDTVNEANENK